VWRDEQEVVGVTRPVYERDGITLYHGDCRKVLRTMARCSVDTIITDPPYHLTQMSRNGSPRRPGTGPYGRVRVGERGFMGTTWDGGGVAFDPATWRAVGRVAKPGAFLLVFGGTRTFHRLTCAIEDAGWEIRDCLVWLYGSGFPKSHNISKAIDTAAGAEREVVGVERMKRMASPKGRPNSGYALNQPQITYAHTAPATTAAQHWHGWGTGLKPAWEPIIVAMKPLDGTFAQNALKHGVAGLNIAGGRIAGPAGSGVWGSSNATCQQGRSFNASPSGDTYRSQQHARGRWPANVLLSHASECRFLGMKRIRGSPSSKTFHAGYRGVSVTTFLRGVSYPGNQHADVNGTETVQAWVCQPGCPVRVLDEQSGERRAGGNLRGEEPSRPFKSCYGEMAGRRLWASYGDSGGASRFFYCAKAGRAERRQGLPPGAENNHPTVKPLELMKYLCRLTATPTGGVVLDPFAGSGTTLLAATAVGRACIGIERDPAYCTIARHRL